MFYKEILKFVLAHILKVLLELKNALLPYKIPFKMRATSGSAKPVPPSDILYVDRLTLGHKVTYSPAYS
jgi:hypothetical protein